MPGSRSTVRTGAASNPRDEELVVTQSAFDELCSHIASEGIVAFDTEFISEFSYRPELCLLQFATRKRRAAVDPFQVRDLTPWWDLMIGDQVTVVVHGGREEVRFCLDRGGAAPRKLVDIQLAEALRSTSFPMSYATIVQRVLGITTTGKETRTDWRRRPLTDQQIDYALEDVTHVLDIWAAQKSSLEERGRLGWVEAEFSRFIDELAGDRGREPWRRLGGIQSLRPRELAVTRELFNWREHEAAIRNKPPRKVLRDDLIIELAHRHPTTVDDLLATRDMNRGDYRRMAPEILSAIARGMSVPDNELPQNRRRHREADEQILAQLLGMALANRCLQMDVALSLVGSNSDLKDLVRWHVFGERFENAPKLTEGWRAEVCGDLLTQVLDGRIALRVADPRSDCPLVFDKVDLANVVSVPGLPTHAGRRSSRSERRNAASADGSDLDGTNMDGLNANGLNTNGTELNDGHDQSDGPDSTD